MKEQATPFDDPPPGRWYQYICDAGDDITPGTYFRFDEEAGLLLGHDPRTGIVHHLELWQIQDDECWEPLEAGEQPPEDYLEPRPRHRVVWREDITPIPDAVYDRYTLLDAVIKRQLDLDDQLILPENEQVFLDEDSGLYITPAYVRAHDKLIDALYEDLAEHGREGLKHAGEVFAKHHLPLPGWRPRDYPLPFIAEELET